MSMSKKDKATGFLYEEVAPFKKHFCVPHRSGNTITFKCTECGHWRTFDIETGEVVAVREDDLEAVHFGLDTDDEKEMSAFMHRKLFGKLFAN